MSAPEERILLDMPQGLVRYHQTGNFHFLTFSCYHRLPYLNTPSAREAFEESLERMRIRYRFVIAGYVVMPEHVHLLLSEPQIGTLSTAIQALKLSVMKQRSERPFWQARYYDFTVRSGEKTAEKLRYIHRNPVARGLVSKPEEWPRSSFRHYRNGELGRVEIESVWTAAARGYELLEDFEVKRIRGWDWRYPSLKSETRGIHMCGELASPNHGHPQGRFLGEQPRRQATAKGNPMRL